MKKVFLIAILGVGLALVGCAQQTPVQNQNSNQPSAGVNQNVNAMHAPMIHFTLSGVQNV